MSNLKTTLAATRAKQETAADRLYRNSEQGGWNAYLIGVQTANTTYLGSIKTSENTYKTASDAAESAFDTTTVTALSSLKHSGRNLTCLYYNATENPSVLAAYSNTEGGEPTLEVPEQVDTIPGFK